MSTRLSYDVHRKGCKVIITDDNGREFAGSTLRRALRRADQSNRF